MSQRPGTVRERIEDVRRRTPPPATRNARRNYISKDDFAELLGISRSRIYAWTRPNNPDYPDEESRRRLAAASDGRYAPDDFARDHNEVGEVSIALLTRMVRLLEEDPTAAGGELAPDLQRLADELHELSFRLRQVVARASDRWRNG